MLVSQHIPFCHDRWISSARCGSLPNCGNATKHWLKSPCNAVATDMDKAIRRHHSTMQLGVHLSTDPSHALTVNRGILHCDRCGNIGIVKFSNLAWNCEEPKNAGLALLRSIRNDKLPSGVDAWPDPFLIHAGTTNAGNPEVEEVIRNLVLPSLRRIE